MYAITMYDFKKCNFLMNFSSPEMESKLPKGKFGRLKTIAQRTYNNHTHNVDRFDQYLCQYSRNHRIVSWKKAIAIRMVKFAVVVAWRFQLILEPSYNVTQRDFLFPLVYELAGVIPLDKGIAPQHIVTYNGTIRKCVSCVTEKGCVKAGNTPYQCKTCNVHLHPKCFLN